MKIEHELPDIAVVRFRTIAEALIASSGTHHLNDLSVRVLNTLHLNRQSKAEAVVLEVLHQPLVAMYEDVSEYRRTLAVVSLEKEMNLNDFFQALNESNYYPASMSESVSYLRALRGRGVNVSPIFHLGTFILDDQYREQRLLVRDNGTVELVPSYPMTKLKAYYWIVVVKKERSR